MLPNIDDKDGRAKAFMEYAEQRLAQVERIKKNICVTDKPAAGEISAISALSAGQQTVLVKIKKITQQTQWGIKYSLKKKYNQTILLCLNTN